MLRLGAIEDLSAEKRQEVSAWIEANQDSFPDAVRAFLNLHQHYLKAEGNLRKAFAATQRELRRALRLIPSSEKLRRTDSPLDGPPSRAPGKANSPEQELQHRIIRGQRLADWHLDLRRRHNARIKRLKEKLTKMIAGKSGDAEPDKTHYEPERLEDIELTAEELAEGEGTTERFIENLLSGDGADPAMKSANETLMPTGSVLVCEDHKSLPAKLAKELSESRVVKTLVEQRVRYDLSVAVTRIELEVEKKVVVDPSGERRVIAASTIDFGPPRFGVTWEALATLAILVGQFAMPFNRLGTLFSTPHKTFKAGAFGRMLHYVGRRLVPIYLEFIHQLARADVLAGDDTSCRVVEVADYFKETSSPAEEKEEEPPWAGYRTPRVAEASYRRCEQIRDARMQRRQEGDREAKRTKEETPSLGVVIGRRLTFESPRRSDQTPKMGLHTTVVSGRSIADDPRSLIVFYRSHLGSCGNLFELILKERDPKLRRVTLQSDLSTTNLVTLPELLKRFDIRKAGCYAHARRPFEHYRHEDPERCEYMLHLFTGLAIHEQQLDEFGRNRDNVLAVRGSDSREMWNEIRELAEDMTTVWSKATTLGTAARYIVNHFDTLTAYLDDPHLEATNNLRERMLRMERLIENNSMFRKSLEGRFALDIVRTVLQTAVAAGVPMHAYLVSVLRSNEDDVAAHPERFTPHAWAANNLLTEAPPITV